MNSIIEAQETLDEEIIKELERCKDIVYVYENYYLVNGKKPIVRDIDRELVKEFMMWNHPPVGVKLF